MELSDWLKEKGLSAEAYDVEALLDQFLKEMQRGLDGQSSSLAMIPAYLGINNSLRIDAPVAVIDAGGTNLRIGLVSFSEKGTLQQHHFTKQAMPGREKEWTADQFYTLLADALEPFIDQFSSIGFCFSYPAQILPNYDGKLIAWTKEIKIPELVGKNIGAGLLEKLASRGFKDRDIVLLNDTVATLLAGLAQGHIFSASSYIGFILGTGTNIAYVEKNSNIGKLAESDGEQIINVESGGFNALETTIFDQQLNEQSEHPGRHIFEKLISGAYLGDLALLIAKALLSHSIFSASATTYIQNLSELSTVHINHLLIGAGDTGIFETDLFNTEDLSIFKTIFSHIIDRAALLTAVNLAAAIIKSGEGTDPQQPICVNIDGSTYYKIHKMSEKAELYLSNLLHPRGIHIRIIQEGDAPIVGAAIAALTTK